MINDLLNNMLYENRYVWFNGGDARRQTLAENKTCFTKDWDLDPIPDHRLNLQKLHAMGARDAPEEIGPLEFLRDMEKFESLFYTQGHGRAPKYPGSCNGMKRFTQELVSCRAWEKAPRRSARTYITAFTVPKPKKRRLRLICNAVPLNEKMRRIEYDLNLPGLSDIEKLVWKNRYLVEYDGKSWFNQFEIPEAFRDHLTVRVGGSNYRWRTLPMGWNSSVDIAQAASRILQADIGGDSLTYVDNLFRFGDTPDETAAFGRTLEERAKECDAHIELTTEVGHEGDILGCHVDLKNKTIGLTSSFKEKLSRLVDLWPDVAQHGCYKDMWRVFGNVVWSCRVLDIPLAHLHRTMCWVRRAASFLCRSSKDMWLLKAHLPDEVKKELKTILLRISTAGPRPVKGHSPDTFEIYSDASENGWGLAWYGDHLELRHGSFPPFLRDAHIGLKELWGAYKAIQRSPEDRNIRLFVDNTNVLSWLTRWTAGPPLACSLLRKIHSMLGKRKLDVRWIASALNPADEPSRFYAR